MDNNYWKPNYWGKVAAGRVSRRTLLKRGSILAAGAGAIALVGCGDDSGSKNSASPTAASGASPATGSITSGGQLVVAIGGQPTGLSGSLNDSGKFDMFWQQLYNCLVWFDENMVPKPEAAGLAAGWQRTDDVTWVFDLKQGITFHDGTEFDGDVVKFNIERILDPSTEAPALSQWEPVFDPDKPVEVLSRYKVQLNLKQAAPQLLGLLSDRGGVMESPAAIERYGNDGIIENPVGTGPFKLGEWVKDDHLTFSRFDNYKADGDGKYPYLDEVRFQIIPDETVQIESFRAGDVHFVDLPINAVAEFKGDDRFRVYRKDGVGWLGWFLNCNLAPLDDVRVRQALSYSVDRQKLIELSYFGETKQACGPIWEALGQYYNPDLDCQSYDPDKARALLEEAGYGPGEAMIEISHTPESGQVGYGIAGEQPEVVIQAMAKDVGIDVQITPYGPEIFDRFWFDQQNLHAYSTGYSLRSDPGDMMYGTYHEEGTYNAGHASGNDPNRGRFDEVSRLIEQANSTYDVSERKRLFNDAEQIIIDDVRTLFTATNFRVVALNSQFDNFSFYGAGKGSYRTVHQV